ncbi:hypothetical protein CISIN_1g043562mg [Citrus sinensis]|uniref:NB-ARC domain-containing protein n=1 Tax=Citrus sinensis TaxID=2711 RepID=A0A067DSZ5_CITSI|nr:hypothetical protein CISIN_1g043562mg [Citrus sinensis]
MQQLEYTDSEIIDAIKTFEAEAGISSSSKSRDMVGLDDRMEELLDLLIEGPPQLSAVTILDSIGLDKTAFAAEAYSSNYVKHYFDCHAWVQEPYTCYADQILDIIITFLMPSSSRMVRADTDNEPSTNMGRPETSTSQRNIPTRDEYQPEEYTDQRRIPSRYPFPKEREHDLTESR